MISLREEEIPVHSTLYIFALMSLFMLRGDFALISLGIVHLKVEKPPNN